MPAENNTVTVKNVFTVDLEDWFCAYNLRIEVENWHRQEFRVVESTNKILSLLAKYNIRATFFVLGWIAEKVPDLIREIENNGHEIATHGYSHKPLTTLSPEQFDDELKKALDVTNSLVSKPIIGFRAPSFTISHKTLWAIDILKKYGIRYDSSIFPVGFHPDYGMVDSQLNVHQLNGITEVPLSVAEVFGKRIPCSGGGYFRIYPYFITRCLIKICNRQGRSLIFYIHPWELDSEQPKQNLSFSKKLRHYYNLEKTESKLEKLLNDFKFYPMSELLNL